MIDRSPYADRRALIGHFKEALVGAMGHRDEFEEEVASEVSFCGWEFGWVIYERQQMHTAVNVELSRRGLPGVPVEDILYIERQACGHSDYVAQWAIRCADLVLKAVREQLSVTASPRSERRPVCGACGNQIDTQSWTQCCGSPS